MSASPPAVKEKAVKATIQDGYGSPDDVLQLEDIDMPVREGNEVTTVAAAD